MKHSEGKNVRMSTETGFPLTPNISFISYRKIILIYLTIFKDTTTACIDKWLYGKY
jgi:hypothetical protein